MSDTKQKFMDYVSIGQISIEWDKLPCEEKLKLMEEAIRIMQSYNGRTVWYCKARAMGYENFEGEDNTYYKL